MTPIGLPERELFWACVCAEREENLSFGCKYLVSDDACGRELRAVDVHERWQNNAVGWIRDSKREFLADLFSRGPLSCSRVRQEVNVNNNPVASKIQVHPLRKDAHRDNKFFTFRRQH